jgi:hypothetical protein
MKKLIAALTLMLAFSINANAQDTKNAQEAKLSSSKELGQRDANELTKLVGLDDTQSADYARLFEHKYRTLEDKNLSQERKDILAKVIEDKVRAGLNAEQTAKLEKNKDLFTRLTH